MYYSYDLSHNNGIISSFTACSYDKTGGMNLVVNPKECINIEKIRDKHFLDFKCCDSLFCSDSFCRILIGEFKNRSYSSTTFSDGTTLLLQIADQAASTLFIHNSICSNVYEYDKVKIDFYAVLSKEKTYSQSDPTIVMMIFSNYFVLSSPNNVRLGNNLLSQIHYNLHRDYNLVPLLYNNCSVILSSDFDSFISKY